MIDSSIIDPRGLPYDEAVREFKRQYIRNVLRAHGWHMQRTAHVLGMHRNTLTRVMSDLGMDLRRLRRAARKKIARGIAN